MGLAGGHTRDGFIDNHSIVFLGSNINSEAYQNGRCMGSIKFERRKSFCQRGVTAQFVLGYSKGGGGSTKSIGPRPWFAQQLKEYHHL